MLFNFDSYKNLLKQILDEYQYTFLRFDEKIDRKSQNIIYLRHDVDISPYSAFQLGKIEHSLNIKTNYFFQIGAETYNIFNPNVLDIIKNLFSMGHCIGLHINELIFGDNGEKIHSTLKWFKDCITEVHFVVSFHRPLKSILFKKYEAFISAYQSEFFSPDIFLSDSRKNEDFYLKLLNLLKEKISPIQLLLHPVWWYPVKDIVEFKDKLMKRHLSELKLYLKNNFKNLKEYIKDEDHSYGL